MRINKPVYWSPVSMCHSRAALVGLVMGLTVFFTLEAGRSFLNSQDTHINFLDLVTGAAKNDLFRRNNGNQLSATSSQVNCVEESPSKSFIEVAHGSQDQDKSRLTENIVDKNTLTLAAPNQDSGYVSASRNKNDDQRKSMLLSLWEHSPYLHPGNSNGGNIGQSKLPEHLNWVRAPRPPHLENCKAKAAQYRRLDTRRKDGARPRWSIWKEPVGQLQHEGDPYSAEDQGEKMLLNTTATVSSPAPPWVEGADTDNLPMTRRVQRDLWLHQHPRNCNDSQLRFLLADWDSRHNLGLGALIMSVAGLLAIALTENRILVTNNFSRADHAGCVGSGHASWGCYFLPETSTECRNRAVELASQPKAWKQGIVTASKRYSVKNIWLGKVPGHWGSPWLYMQPTSEVDGQLLLHHMAKDRRWWRAQAVRYLMRFPTEYTCNLMNKARHHAFGARAAEMVLNSLPNEWPEVTRSVHEGEMEVFVWGSHKPWVPRPLISVHVRLGDKASEMKMVDFEGYMKLANRIRSYFPNAKNIWLSTEMQDVIEQSKMYSNWNFYYTNITRQTGATSMESYERSLGRETSTTNAFVNFLMAVDSDFFTGALGSTWCFLIDGMRCTAGKEMSGYLSVNKDRYW